MEHKFILRPSADTSLTADVIRGSHQISSSYGDELYRLVSHGQVLHGTHVWHHLRLMEDGARFFDKTVKFENDEAIDTLCGETVENENVQWEIAATSAKGRKLDLWPDVETRENDEELPAAIRMKIVRKLRETSEEGGSP